MSMTPVAQPHHLSRKAVIYIRQSTGHQVLTNTESHQLQHAMREHARHLGWPEERIEVVETDLGRSAQSTAGRDGYKALLADVALGQVGIVLSYESTRLSRNCTDWYPLLDLCAYNQCLIADRDGVYDAATPNGRLLLGMKGIEDAVAICNETLIIGTQIEQGIPIGAVAGQAGGLPAQHHPPPPPSPVRPQGPLALPAGGGLGRGGPNPFRPPHWLLRPPPADA